MLVSSLSEKRETKTPGKGEKEGEQWTMTGVGSGGGVERRKVFTCNQGGRRLGSSILILTNWSKNIENKNAFIRINQMKVSSRQVSSTEAWHGDGEK